MKHSIFFSFMLCILACSNHPDISQISSLETKELLSFQQLDSIHHLQIADLNEKGDRLQLCLHFVNRENQQPLTNQEVILYHTNSSGDYEPLEAGNEQTARLSGSAITDDLGRIFIETILPGSYGNSGDNRHIHTTVYGAKPEGYNIHFKQYTGKMGKRFIKGSDQHFLADLKYTLDSTLVTFLAIAVKNPK